VSFTAQDLARFEAASRLLTAPLAAASLDDWRRGVNRALRELFDGDAAVFMLPGTDQLYYSTDAPGVVAGLERYASLSPDGSHVVEDPLALVWHGMRRSEGIEAFDRDVNARMVERAGHTLEASPFVQDVLLNNGLHDFVGAYSRVRAGEVLLWVLQEKPGGGRFGAHDAEVMRALVPSLRAGLATLDHLHAHRAALDHVEEPIAAFTLDGRELFRNAALVALVAAEPESDALLATVRRAAADARSRYLPSLRLAPASPFAPERFKVRTRRAQYAVRATVVEPGSFHADESVLATVQVHAAPSLLHADALRDRFGLTPREVDVALLVAEGCSNPEIAERLFLSLHTVKRHVEQVLAKLNVTSRAAVHARLLQPHA
jgi:DNA-binding CsgD family transcriptional regulator